MSTVTIFVNGYRVDSHPLVDDAYMRVWIFSTGEVFHYFVESLTISCPLDASLFPFDTQTCTQTFRSQDYTYNDINVFSGTFPYRTVGGAMSNYAPNTGRF
jgi:hypothetical protein